MLHQVVHRPERWVVSMMTHEWYQVTISQLLHVVQTLSEEHWIIHYLYSHELVEASHDLQPWILIQTDWSSSMRLILLDHIVSIINGKFNLNEEPSLRLEQVQQILLIPYRLKFFIRILLIVFIKGRFAEVEARIFHIKNCVGSGLVGSTRSMVVFPVTSERSLVIPTLHNV